MKESVFIGLGGNIGESVKIITRALAEIKKIPEVESLRCSNFYRTSPVSPIIQRDYVNAVCHLQTSLSAKALLRRLQAIEQKLGKEPKSKESPRIIDLDIIFYGQKIFNDRELIIPHPKWRERLFVLVPLSGLLNKIHFPAADKNDIISAAYINGLITALRKKNEDRVEDMRTGYEKSGH